MKLYIFCLGLVALLSFALSGMVIATRTMLARFLSARWTDLHPVWISVLVMFFLLWTLAWSTPTRG
ncbi:putative iron-regulated membrane protein [Robbsia andropogonis]|uniref:hypothetical protein n=1 Tax=Robbsia andropogonis TaxID=28092 RepID=UPI00209DC510|nr:hypothetical protein [Robbsia andropogonis]MCP1116917.1 hypothetical protein [Robbsia andropogonis]MCP1126404.1 hypothetical protein [Robbsia andropogonis]